MVFCGFFVINPHQMKNKYFIKLITWEDTNSQDHPLDYTFGFTVHNSDNDLMKTSWYKNTKSRWKGLSRFLAELD